MTVRRKLLILHDSADFGGHERMLMALLPGVFETPAFEDVAIVVPTSNGLLRDALAKAFPALRQIASPFTKNRGEPYLRHLRLGYRRAVRVLIAAERPDIVLLVQGRIENLAVPLTVIPKGIRVVSYVPMAHRLSEMGRSGGSVGDAVRRALYRRPDQFIVPSDSVAEQIVRAGGTAPVAVAPNVVMPPPQTPKAAAREQLTLPTARRIALFIGRLDVAAKGIDTMLDALRRTDSARMADWTFLFVGSGPGQAAIAALAVQNRLDIRMVTWTDRPDLYVAAADIMLLPSRWEGVPLTMLEAMEYGLPILASDIEVYRRFLSSAHVCDYRTVDLAETLPRLIRPHVVTDFTRQARATLAPVSIDASRRTFVEALVGTAAA